MNIPTVHGSSPEYPNTVVADWDAYVATTALLDSIVRRRGTRT